MNTLICTVLNMPWDIHVFHVHSSLIKLCHLLSLTVCPLTPFTLIDHRCFSHNLMRTQDWENLLCSFATCPFPGDVSVRPSSLFLIAKHSLLALLVCFSQPSFYNMTCCIINLVLYFVVLSTLSALYLAPIDYD